MSRTLNRTYLPSLTLGIRAARSSVRTQLSGRLRRRASSPRCQEILRIAHAFAVMLAAAAGDAFGQKPRKERQQRRESDRPGCASPSRRPPRPSSSCVLVIRGGDASLSGALLVAARLDEVHECLREKQSKPWFAPRFSHRSASAPIPGQQAFRSQQPCILGRFPRRSRRG